MPFCHHKSDTKGNMKNFYLVVIAVAGILSFFSQSSTAQCSTTGTPSFPSTCTGNYITSITASGTGVTSTISFSSSSCSGTTYFNYYTTQGIIAPAGTVVTVPISRGWTPGPSYYAYLSIFVDWNDNGTYETTELAGSTIYLPAYTASTNYTFTVPVTGVVTGTNLHMRVFLGEGTSISAPCSATWGRAVDFYCNVVCPLSTLAVSPTATSICAGGPGAILTASGAATYTWSPSASLSASTGDNVTALPGTTTTYTVTGTDVTGCVGTATTTVTVNPLPPTTITPSPAAVCAGGSITLNAPAVSGNTYQWYNGVTLLSGSTNSSYTASPGATTTYSVQVTSAAGCTATSAATTVTVNPLPPAVLSASGPLAICPGSSVTLSVGTGAGYTYQWYNGPTAIAGATNSFYNTNAAGDYYAVVTTASGCQASTGTATVSINPAPVATITVSGPTTFCANDSVTFTANSGTGYTYQWSTGAGLIPGATNITYVAHSGATYSVTVTNSYGCSTTSAAGVGITVNPLPVTTITAVGATTRCFPNTVMLNAVPGAGYTYQWYTGSTAISGATNASYTASATGTYVVDIVNPATGCTASTPVAGAITVTILPRPDATITPSSPDHRFCSYDSVILSGIAGAGLTYQWLISGIPITGATNSTYASHNSGTYKLVVYNGSCYDTSTTPYIDTVDAAPSSVILTSGAVAFCEGASVTLTAATGAGYTYQWYYGPTVTLSSSSPIAGATTSLLLVDTTGYYHALINSPQGCVTTSAIIYVRSVPMPVISAGGPLAFCDGINVVLSVAPVTGGVYQWKRNGINIPGAVAANYIATSTGDYSCFVNVPGVCATTTSAVHVTVWPSPHPVITFDGTRLHVAGGYVSYQWYMNTVTIPAATTNVYAPWQNASYRVLVTDTNGCSKLSDGFEIFNLGIDNANVTTGIKIYPNPVANTLHIVGMPLNSNAAVMSMEGKLLFTSKAEDMNMFGLSAGMYMVVISDEKGRRLYVEKVVKE